MTSTLGDPQRVHRDFVDHESRGVERAAEGAAGVAKLEIEATRVRLAARA